MKIQLTRKEVEKILLDYANKDTLSNLKKENLIVRLQS